MPFEEYLLLMKLSLANLEVGIPVLLYSSIIPMNRLSSYLGILSLQRVEHYQLFLQWVVCPYEEQRIIICSYEELSYRLFLHWAVTP